MKRVLRVILSMVMILALSVPAAAFSTVAITGITAVENPVNLAIGGSCDLKVTLSPQNTTQRQLIYSTANKLIATVDANGKVTGVAAGTTTITVTSAAKKSVSTKVTVTVLKPVTFTMFASDPNPNWNDMKDAVGQAITKRTGVTLKVEYAVGDPKQKVALIAASGKYPDLIYAKYTNLMVDAGALLDLTPLINKYAPNIKKVYGDYMVRQQWSLSDKSIYELATVDSINNQVFDATGGFELQYAVLKDQNYPKIRTTADYEKAIKAYKQKYPTIDGKPTIGLSLLAEDWRSMITVRNPGFQATGEPDNGEWYIDPKTYKATQHYLRPEEKEYFRWLNHMNAIGLLDPESFTQKYDQYKAKIATGTVLAIIDQEWEYGDGENSLRASGKGDRAYAHFPVTTSTKFKANDFNMPGFSGGVGTSITTSCKDPVRAIKFLDFISSDEGQVLANWGVKDLTYKVDAKGIRYVPDDVQNEKTNNNAAWVKKTGVGQYRLSIRYGDGVKDSTGSYYSTNFPSQIVAAYPAEEKEILKHYNATTWKDLFPKENEFKQRPYGAAWMISVPADSDLNVMNTKFDDDAKKLLPEAILCPPGEFDATYQKFTDKLLADGAKTAGEIYSSYVKDKVLQWSK